MGRTRGEKCFAAANYLLLGAVAFVSLYPFLYVVSLSSAAEAQRSGLHLYPREISLAAYATVLSSPEIVTGYLNTIFRTVVGTTLTLIFACLTAYPLARPELPWRRGFILLVLFTMIFTGGLVPGYLLIRGLGLLDSRWVYVLPPLLSAFNVIVLKNFFQSVPENLAEAARVEGAGEWTILWRIYVPLSLPALATIALWTAVAHWNMWFDAMLYINTDGKQVMQTFLQRLVIENSSRLLEMGFTSPDPAAATAETIKAAMVVVTILPIVLLYPFLQKYFVKGILLGGVKG